MPTSMAKKENFLTLENNDMNKMRFPEGKIFVGDKEEGPLLANKRQCCEPHW